MEAGFDVKMNEVHGMAQRGGSVIAQIRYGKQVFSPLVEEGTAKVLCSLELIEAIRYAHYLASDGLAIISNQSIVPVTASMGVAKYPDDAPETIGQIFNNYKIIDVVSPAKELGNPRMANTIMVGAVSKALDIDVQAWQRAIESQVKPKFVEMNLKAFEYGRNLV